MTWSCLRPPRPRGSPSHSRGPGPYRGSTTEIAAVTEAPAASVMVTVCTLPPQRGDHVLLRMRVRGDVKARFAHVSVRVDRRLRGGQRRSRSRCGQAQQAGGDSGRPAPYSAHWFPVSFSADFVGVGAVAGVPHGYVDPGWGPSPGQPAVRAVATPADRRGWPPGSPPRACRATGSLPYSDCRTEPGRGRRQVASPLR